MGSEYRNAWEKLVAENGLKRAKEIMRERRKLVKRPGLASMDEETKMEVIRKGQKVRRKNYEKRQRAQGQDPITSKDLIESYYADKEAQTDAVVEEG